MNETCSEKLCELRHPKRWKFFDRNSKCKFENCANAHLKYDKKVKIKSLEIKCAEFELNITKSKDI